MSMVRLILPESSVVNAGPPASVAAGNVETSQRITDVLFRAFRERSSGPHARTLAGHDEQHHRWRCGS